MMYGGPDFSCPFGCYLITPNCQRGLTVWVGPLIFVAAWSKSVGRGFDLHWRSRELFCVNF